MCCKEEKPKVKFLKIREVKSPVRGSIYSAGMDWFIPTFTPEYIEALKAENKDYWHGIYGNKIHLPGHSSLKFPSGIKVNIENGYYLSFENKSGRSWNDKLVHLASVIDQDYENEVFITIQNVSDKGIYIEHETKIIQSILHKCEYEDWVEVFTDKEMFYKESTRAGGFGSTGIK